MTLRSAAPAFLLLIALLPRPARAQSASLEGTVVDSATAAPVAGVRVRLTGDPDTAVVRIASSAEDGRFALRGLPAGRYQIELARLGYAVTRRSLLVAPGNQSLGRLRIRAVAVPLGGVEVRSSPPAAIQQADTTELAASAVKTHRDATAEELVTRMPGITVDNTGAVKSNGEAVQQVLVDGKPFFSSDPTIALRNLPADVIDKIQVYDKLSDQAEFSGFDDGQSIKTMNVVLRADRRRATFGKGFAGAGEDRHYQAGGNLNLLRGGTRAAVIGLANDVNQQNFSPQDLLGVLSAGGPRGGGGFGGMPGGRRFGGDRGGRGDFAGGPPGGAANFLVGPQDGVTTTRALGLHAQGTWAGRLSVSQSYFVNDTDNRNLQELSRGYVLPLDSVASYQQSSRSRTRNRNHRLDGRIEWQADSSSSLIDQPRLYFQGNRTQSALAAENDVASGAVLSRGETDGRTTTDGHDLSNHLLVRHRFATRGRTVSLDLGAGHVSKVGNGTQRAELSGLDASDTLDQRSDLHTTTASLSARLAWTEPIGRNGALQATYAPSLSRSQSNSLGESFDPVTGSYSIPDSARTNRFTSTSTSQNGGIGYLTGRGPYRLTANLAWQRSTLRVERQFPAGHSLERVFHDLLPSLMLNGNLSGHRNLRLSWNTSTRAPSIAQLQDVVDNSNPLVLTTGNPGLQPATVQAVVARYSATDAARSHGRFLVLSVQRTAHFIGNSTITASRDTVIQGVALRQGTQLVSPANLGSRWSTSAFGTLSRPAQRLHSVLNLNSGLTWTRTPGLVNGIASRSDSWAMSGGVVVASNVSEALDFTLAWNGSVTVARNPSSAAGNSDSYAHTVSLRLNWTTSRGVVMRQEVSHTLLNGVAGGFGQDMVLWNSSLGQKLFGNRVDLRLAATDILGQNRSTNRTVTESYIQDARNRTVPRTVMLIATCTWGAGGPAAGPRPPRDRSRPGGGITDAGGRARRRATGRRPQSGGSGTGSAARDRSRRGTVGGRVPRLLAAAGFELIRAIATGTPRSIFEARPVPGQAPDSPEKRCAATRALCASLSSLSFSRVHGSGRARARFAPGKHDPAWHLVCDAARKPAGRVTGGRRTQGGRPR